MSAMTRHAEAAHRASGFVWQTMHGRGIHCTRPELEAALVELSPEQLAQVHTAATSVAKGSDRAALLGLLGALRTIGQRNARAALATHSILYRADVLLPLASADATTVAFARDLALLQRPGVSPEEVAQAAARLRSLCGPLGHEDLLPATAPPSLPPAPPPPYVDVDDDSLPPLPGHEGWPSAAAPAAPLAEPAGLIHPDAADAAPTAGPRAGAVARSARVYGKAAAMVWEVAPLRSPERGSSVRYTVMIEGARADGEGGYAWRDKVVFSVTAPELPQMLAVLMGWIEAVEFRFHSGSPKKNMAVRHQSSGVVVHLQGLTQALAVPVSDADRYALASLVLHTMVANEPLSSAEAVLQVCRAVMTRPVFGPGRDLSGPA
jgi:hypothetical protein